MQKRRSGSFWLVQGAVVHTYLLYPSARHSCSRLGCCGVVKETVSIGAFLVASEVDMAWCLVARFGVIDQARALRLL